VELGVTARQRTAALCPQAIGNQLHLGTSRRGSRSGSTTRYRSGNMALLRRGEPTDAHPVAPG